MAVETPAAPLLATVPGVELASVGYWDISNAEDWHPSVQDLASAVAALDCPAVRRPALKFGHTGEPGAGDPSIGLVDNMRLTEDGQTLVGDFVGIPSWFAQADSEGRAVIAAAYPDRSGEFARDFVCQLGHTHPFVMLAVALLGVERPGIGTLESLYDLYTKAPEKETVMAKAAVALAAGTSIDDIRRAYYDGPGSNWFLWIREMFIDPAELIVQNDEDESLQRVSYTITGDGQVEFGDSQDVKIEYVNARAATEKPALAFASRAEARPKNSAAAAESSKAASNNNTEESDVTTLNPKEGLTQLLGLPADADDEAVQKAYDAALAAKQTAEPDGGDAATEAPADVEPTLDKLAASAKRLGQTVLDEKTAEQLVADAAAGREALKQITAQRHDQIVSAAIGDGKIPPARKAHYMGLMQRDPEGTEKFLAEAPKEAAVPISEMGHSTEPVTEVTDDPAYKNWSV